ncbi:MAG: hypothetical protein HYX32_05750 [Actinobacteria bacterium]|nr:hypothetical protein [Actinomycetota bacterium]
MSSSKRMVTGASAFVLAIGWVVGLAASPAHASTAELRVGGSTVIEGNGATNGSAKVSMRLSEPLASTVCVWYRTVNGSAAGAANTKINDASHDYVSRTGKFVKIPAGKVTGTISVTTLYDTEDELDENLNVVVDMVSTTTGRACNTSPDLSVTVVAGTAIVTILDDDPAPGTPTVSVGDATVAEGNAAPNGSARLGLRLSQPLATAKCVWYHTENGTATGAPNTKTHDASNDYLTRTGKTAKIPASKTVGSVGITILYDTEPESNEKLYVIIDKVSDAIGTACETAADPTVAIGRKTGTVTIVNDDGVAGTPGAPTGVTAARGQDPCTNLCGRVDVTWNPPANSGSSPITSYAVYANYGSGWFTFTSTSSTSITANCGLPAVTCAFQVAAVNAVGTGPRSDISNLVTTQNVPDPPTGATASLGSLGSPTGVVNITWTPPAQDGGSPLVEYAIYVSVDGSGFSYWSSGTSTTRSGNWGPATTVQFQVRANNSVGSSAAALSNSVTTPSPGE